MTRNVQAEIDAKVKSERVVLFMKGSPDMPMCGFSATVVAVLREHGTQFASVDVLSDSDVRDGIKQYSDWPTIPQLYVKGEFVGGCDIIREMHAKGELATMLQQAVA